MKLLLIVCVGYFVIENIHTKNVKKQVVYLSPKESLPLIHKKDTEDEMQALVNKLGKIVMDKLNNLDLSKHNNLRSKAMKQKSLQNKIINDRARKVMYCRRYLVELSEAFGVDCDEIINLAAPHTFKIPKEFDVEIGSSDMTDLVTNLHQYVPQNFAYSDLGRRFVPQYPYTEVLKSEEDEDAAENQLDEAIKEALQGIEEDERLKPIRADPDMVIAIARESAALEASKPADPTSDLIQNNLLRNQDYWNGYIKEDVPYPDEISLRSQKSQNSKLETIRVKMLPGSHLYQIVTLAKKISPKLLYIINKNKDEP